MSVGRSSAMQGWVGGKRKRRTSCPLMLLGAAPGQGQFVLAPIDTSMYREKRGLGKSPTSFVDFAAGFP